MTTSAPRDDHASATMGQRLVWGLRWGLSYVVVFGGLAAVLRLLDGPRSFVEHGTSLAAFIEAYVAAGAVGGLVLGLTKPWLKYAAGSAIIGAFVGSLVGFALLIVNTPLTDWSAFDFLLPGAFALCGCVVGIRLHQKGNVKIP